LGRLAIAIAGSGSLETVVAWFVSDQDPAIIGFTPDQTGGNLPEPLGPWRGEAISGIVVFGCDNAQISKVVRDGFFVVTDTSVYLRS
jgi:hypothetical protein